MAIDEKTIRSIKARFIQINQERFSSTLTLTASRHRPLIEVLPLLFHLNDKELPGNAYDDTPCGVFGFNIDPVISQARRLWKGFSLPRRPFASFDIEAIFLMGSCGSIAFNRNSDFDVWICYQNDLNKEKIKLLQSQRQSNLLTEKHFGDPVL